MLSLHISCARSNIDSAPGVVVLPPFWYAARIPPANRSAASGVEVVDDSANEVVVVEEVYPGEVVDALCSRCWFGLLLSAPGFHTAVSLPSTDIGGAFHVLTFSPPSLPGVEPATPLLLLLPTPS